MQFSASIPRHFQIATIVRYLALASLLITAAGCDYLPKQEAQAQSSERGSEQGGAVAVETAIAQTGTLEDPIEYTGTTQPVTLVSLRPQVEGQLLALNVDVGDRVQRGQVIGRLDDGLLITAVREAQAELAARESEVAQARVQVSDAQTLVEQARLEYQQAAADADRLTLLANQGAISVQQAETAQTAKLTAEQAVRSAQQQVRTREQAVAAAQRRVAAQQAVVAEAAERRSYTVLSSPISGAVLQRVAEPGNIVQPGNEILRLGNFS